MSLRSAFRRKRYPATASASRTDVSCSATTTAASTHRGQNCVPDRLTELVERALERAARSVDARVHHRVERVRDMDDPRSERNLDLGQARRIAGAVEVLVVMADRRDGVCEKAESADDLGALRRDGSASRPAPTPRGRPASSGSRRERRSCRCRGTAPRGRGSRARLGRARSRCRCARRSHGRGESGPPCMRHGRRRLRRAPRGLPSSGCGAAGWPPPARRSGDESCSPRPSAAPRSRVRLATARSASLASGRAERGTPRARRGAPARRRSRPRLRRARTRGSAATATRSCASRRPASALPPRGRSRRRGGTC